MGSRGDKKTESSAPGKPVTRASDTEVEKGAGGEDLPPWPALVCATIPSGRRVCSPFAEDDFTASLRKALDEDCVIILDSPGEGAPNADIGFVLSSLAKGDVLFGALDSAEVRAAYHANGLNVFKVAGAEDRVYAATYELPDAAWLETVAAEPTEKGDLAMTPTTPGHKVPEQGRKKKPAGNWADVVKQEVRIQKVHGEDERIVTGIVLEPDGVDAQNDTISPGEIRSAAHKFMQEYGNVGLQHQTFINGKARILESYVAPSDMLVGDQVIRKGTWLMSMRVLDDDIWKAVKRGDITGFSIGGEAVRLPDVPT
jgi:hypothetical protein